MNSNTIVELPIVSKKDEIAKVVCNNRVTIITGPTGSGKSTMVAWYLKLLGFFVVLTQPRRLAAVTIAERIALKSGKPIGETVGYHISGERKENPKTEILVCSDGVAMVRQLLGRRRNNRNRILIVDEIHDWNLNMEALIAWVKYILKMDKNIRLVLMSATLQAKKLSEFFDNAPIVKVLGRMFPIENRDPSKTIEDDAIKLAREGKNVLIFQPGKKEIGACINALRAMRVSAEILPLHAELTPEEQALCFGHYERPKIIVATNVAQTSITIDDINAVISSGVQRRCQFRDGVESITLCPISHYDTVQQKGRAGRTGPGIFINHCPSKNQPKSNPPEIKESCLAMMFLRLASIGIDMEELEFFHQPTKATIADARRSLKALGLLDRLGAVTPIGEKVLKMPLEPKYGRMIVEADLPERRVVDDIITIVAILSVGGIVDRHRWEWKQFCNTETESDAIAQMKVYYQVCGKTEKELRLCGINAASYFRVCEKRTALYDALKGKVTFGTTNDRTAILKSVCSGLVEHVYQQTADGYMNGDGIARELSNESMVTEAPWIVGVPRDIETPKGMVKIVTMASAIELPWLPEVARHLVKYEKGSDPFYSAKYQSVVSTIRVTFRGHKIAEGRELDPKHPDAPELFAAFEEERLKREGLMRVEHDQSAKLFAALTACKSHQCWGDLEPALKVDVNRCYYAAIPFALIELREWNGKVSKVLEKATAQLEKLAAPKTRASGGSFEDVLKELGK